MVSENKRAEEDDIERERRMREKRREVAIAELFRGFFLVAQ